MVARYYIIVKASAKRAKADAYLSSAIGKQKRRNVKASKEKSRLGATHSWRRLQRQLAMAQSTPWVERRYGRKLLNTLGTVKAVLNASPSQLTQAAGIPPATATKIHRLINQPYSEEHPTGEQQKEVEEYT